jgi:hypothetical protein
MVLLVQGVMNVSFTYSRKTKRKLQNHLQKSFAKTKKAKKQKESPAMNLKKKNKRKNPSFNYFWH